MFLQEKVKVTSFQSEAKIGGYLGRLERSHSIVMSYSFRCKMESNLRI